MPATETAMLVIQRMSEADPIACAKHVESLEDAQASELLGAIGPDAAARILRHVETSYAGRLLRELHGEVFVPIVSRLDAQRSADILLELPEEQRLAFLEAAEPNLKKEIREILAYPEGSAGRIMSREYIALHRDIKVRDAVRKIRELTAKGFNAFYVYVIDDEQRLVGVMNMRDMLLAEDGDVLERVMRKKVFAVDAFMDREDIARELSARRFFAAPVVERDGRLIGAVKSDQIIGEMQEEATEDLQKLFGAGGDERAFSPILFSVKKRLPWLHVNLLTAFMAASVVALFEDIIARITVLAVFLPVVAGQGGNAGAQSLAVVMRALVMREIPKGMAWKLVIKETRLGAIQGIIIGVVTAGITWVWHGNGVLGLVIGMAMILNLVIAGFAGALIPLAMKRIGLDPAQCSSIILTTVTDIFGFFVFIQEGGFTPV
ncbi:MAG: magnesium transporter, partial [Candidatus Omnitrophica bacterium]|nr:magnesium transporter [Candidatus Omnitrophota bacterium]